MCKEHFEITKTLFTLAKMKYSNELVKKALKELISREKTLTVNI